MNNIYFSTHQGRLGNIIYWIGAWYYCTKKFLNCNFYIEQDPILYYATDNQLDKSNLYNYIKDNCFTEKDIKYDVSFDENDCLYIDQYVGDIISMYPNKDIYFNGIFFQDYKYILSFKNSIKNILYSYNKKINIYLNKIDEFGVDNCLLMSVRHGNDYMNAKFYVLNSLYYIDMYNKHFQNIKNIFVTTDNIEWCKENIKIDNVNFIYIDDLTPIEIITLGFYFKNYICANSSFSSSLELLSNYDNHKSVGVNNLSKGFRRYKLFSPQTIIYDIEGEYNQYIENIDTLYNG